MIIHLLDGTYDCSATTSAGLTPVVRCHERRGNVLTMLSEGATHLGVASDPSSGFRNDLWDGYKRRGDAASSSPVPSHGGGDGV
jgi:hypothetical protein